jgi:hypothetical protein
MSWPAHKKGTRRGEETRNKGQILIGEVDLQACANQDLTTHPTEIAQYAE